jgi:RNA polymerase sigma-70 factor (ECF subfamily)
LAAAVSGSSDAVTRLYLDHVTVVVGYLRACGVVDPDEAVSEVFLAMVQDLDRFRGGRSEFRRWLLGMAHRRVVDRSGERTGAVRRHEPAELPAGTVAPIVDTFLGLADEQRQVVALRFVVGASLEEVAMVIDRPVTTVRYLLEQALSALRRRSVAPAPAPAAAEGVLS